MIGHTRIVKSVGVSLCGLYVFSGSDDKLIKLWSLKSFKFIKTLKGHDCGISAVIMSSAGYIISGSKDKSVKLWDIESSRIVKAFSNKQSTLNALDVSRCNR